MLPILYSFRRCPYAMRARMALKYSQINIEHREILLKNKPLSMLQYSAKGTVPVLVIADTVIDESLDIMHWALQNNDPEDWLLTTDADKQQQMLDLIETCDTKFKPLLDKYKYSDRHELSEEYYRNNAEWFLVVLDQKLKQHQQLISDNISLADIAIFPFIRQFAFVNKIWFDNTEYKHLQNWLNHHIQSKLFLSIMQKHSLWRDESCS